MVWLKYATLRQQPWKSGRGMEMGLVGMKPPENEKTQGLGEVVVMVWLKYAMTTTNSNSNVHSHEWDIVLDLHGYSKKIPA